MPGDEDCFLVSVVVAEIVAHLKLSPMCGDTAVGVRQWWLSATRNRVETNVVETALDHLVGRGALGVRVLPSGERFYFGLGTPEKPGGDER